MTTEQRDKAAAFQARRKAAHYPIHKAAGDGYHEPRQDWITCSCGVLVWEDEQGMAGPIDTPSEAMTEHRAEQGLEGDGDT